MTGKTGFIGGFLSIVAAVGWISGAGGILVGIFIIAGGTASGWRYILAGIVGCILAGLVSLAARWALEYLP
jgi:hypothetical protein